MKRTSSRAARRNVVLALHRWRHDLKRRSFSHDPNTRFVVAFPEKISFAANFDGTIRAISELKREGHRVTYRTRRLVLDFSSVRSVSVACLLVLVSELSRIETIWKIRAMRKAQMSIKGIDQCSDRVLAMLDSMGLFDFVSRGNVGKWQHATDRQASVWSTIACSKLAPDRVDRLTKTLHLVAEVFEHHSYFYDAMIEAVHNTNQHAYPSEYDFVFQPLDGAWWWATACFEREEAAIKFCVFDQGVGIPETLPRWSLWENIRGFMDEHSPISSSLLKDDARMIHAAMMVSRTSKNAADGRGQGLIDVLAPIEELGEGRLRILSGCGMVIYEGGKFSLVELSQHIGGTLIEWTIPARQMSTLEE